MTDDELEWVQAELAAALAADDSADIKYHVRTAAQRVEVLRDRTEADASVADD